MTIQLPEQVASDRTRAGRIVMRERVRMKLQIAAVALAGCFALGLLIFDEPARRRGEATDQQALAACTRVYDGEACDCAIRATAAPFSGSMPQDSSPSTPGGTGPGVLRIRDFVHLVQACMAQRSDAPVD